MNDDEQQVQYDAEAEARVESTLKDAVAGRGLIDTGSQNITGYRRQTESAKELVNSVKAFERTVAQWIRRTYFEYAKHNSVGLDPRQVAEARTHFEYAFYHLNRAIFQPADPIGDAVSQGLRRD